MLNRSLEDTFDVAAISSSGAGQQPGVKQTSSDISSSLMNKRRRPFAHISSHIHVLTISATLIMMRFMDLSEVHVTQRSGPIASHPMRFTVIPSYCNIFRADSDPVQTVEFHAKLLKTCLPHCPDRTAMRLECE